MAHNRTAADTRVNVGGIQSWSQGDIFPAVIHLRETYSDTGEFRYAEHVLTLDGREEAYAEEADARQVAVALLESPFFRAQWNASEDFATAEAREDQFAEHRMRLMEGGLS